MRFRSRLAVVMAAVVTAVLCLACLAVYLSTRAQLTGALARSLAVAAGGSAGGPPAPSTGGRELDVQVVRTDGTVVHLGAPGLTLPLVGRAQRVAAGRAPPFLSEVSVGQIHLLVDTTTDGPGQAIQVAASLAGVEATLHELALVLVVVVAAGAALAALAGLGASRPLLAPLQHLGRTAAQVAATRDLSRRLDVAANDELGRIASAFNAMMSALEQSRRAQHQLVADASHELRTPLTSLRTNLEVLTRSDRLSPGDRTALTADLVDQLEELTVLVGDLADLARESGPEPMVEEVDLAELVAGAVERARRRAPQLDFVTELSPAVVRGDAGRLARAVANLVDNAIKWSPAGTAVEVSLGVLGDVPDAARSPTGSASGPGRAVLEVRDHGPGIPPGDLPFVFDRFYRAGGDRRLPGSGLGLAIVRQVAEWHGGSVSAGSAGTGGASLRLELPVVPVPAAASDSSALRPPADPGRRPPPAGPGRHPGRPARA